jgi:hypothetical protein
MGNNEKPARRTRRSFIKKSAAAGIGAKSALIFGGLVMTSSASGSSCSGKICCKIRVGGSVKRIKKCDSGGGYCNSNGIIYVSNMDTAANPNWVISSQCSTVADEDGITSGPYEPGPNGNIPGVPTPD